VLLHQILAKDITPNSVVGVDYREALRCRHGLLPESTSTKAVGRVSLLWDGWCLIELTKVVDEVLQAKENDDATTDKLEKFLAGNVSLEELIDIFIHR
jgi:hypothetical protein